MHDSTGSGSDDLAAVAADCETVDLTVGEHRDHVATLTLDRPDARNAMNAQLRDEVAAVVAALDDSEVRVVVLTGSDESHSFAAGADVRELQDRTFLEQRERSKRPRIYERVEGLDQPVIARVNGHALGGGCELALACDVRIADTTAKLGFPEVTLGLIPGGGGTQRLPRLVGEGEAMRLILSGAVVDATDAADRGLVDEVCDPEDLDEAVYGLAGAMAENSPVALEYAKRAIRASSQLGLEDGIEYEAELFAGVLASEDSSEGIRAFLEDEAPEWPGK